MVDFRNCVLQPRGDPRMHNYVEIRTCITTSDFFLFWLYLWKFSFFDYIIGKFLFVIIFLKKKKIIFFNLYCLGIIFRSIGRFWRGVRVILDQKISKKNWDQKVFYSIRKSHRTGRDRGKINRKDSKKILDQRVFFRPKEATGPARTRKKQIEKHRKNLARRITGPAAGSRHRARQPGSRHRARVAGDPAPGYGISVSRVH